MSPADWLRPAVRRLSSLSGVVVAAAGIGFLALRLSAEWDRTSRLLAEASWGWLAPALATALSAMTLIGVGWWRSITALGARTPLSRSLRWFFPGQLGKYVPGGIWPVVGMAELATRGGVPRAAAYAGTGMSMALLYCAAGLVVAVAAPFAVASGGSTDLYLAAALVPGVLAVMHPAVLLRLVALAEKVIGKGVDVKVPPWRTVIRIVLVHVPVWPTVAVATWLVARAFHPDPDPVQVGAAAVFSWIVGFVFLPAPGGVGVREAAFAAAAGSALGAEAAAAVALCARMCFLAADLLAAVAALALSGRAGSTSRGDDRAARYASVARDPIAARDATEVGEGREDGTEDEPGGDTTGGSLPGRPDTGMAGDAGEATAQPASRHMQNMGGAPATSSTSTTSKPKRP
ncbi:MAG: hypothetical protein KatS3mg008_1737 [Acidimicrobiales bacterium]|nr:MAG: hypothetical protein KatS3mg008_1737 [Acidimicrobiales bacterium]